MATIERVLVDVTPEGEEGARRELRRQVARLERRLAGSQASGFPHVAVSGVAVAVRGPRLLTLGELECLRDDLAERVRKADAALAERGAFEELNRARLEEMRRDPRAHRFARVRAADIGEGGCGEYKVKPRVGLVGMLAGWWHIKVSSGCPLAAPHRIRRDGTPQPQALRRPRSRPAGCAGRAPRKPGTRRAPARP